jgi:hypothetical protein
LEITLVYQLPPALAGGYLKTKIQIGFSQNQHDVISAKADWTFSFFIHWLKPVAIEKLYINILN